MMDLENKRNKLISDYIQKSKFEDNKKFDYICCLEEIKKLKSFEMKEVYDFFINRIKEDQY